MARLREFDGNAAIAAVERVFWRRGYDGASYADLMEATGLGKGSLYAAFGDKRALYRQALSSYVDREVALLETALVDDRTGAAAQERLSAVMRYPITMAQAQDTGRLGCFLCHSAMEVAPDDPEVAMMVANAMARIDRALRTGLTAAGAPPDLAPTFSAIYFGLQVMARAGAPIAALEASVAGAEAMLANACDVE